MEVDMATAAKKQTKIETVPLPDNVNGMPVKLGKVVKQQNNFYILIGQKKILIPIGLFISPKDLTKLVNKDVGVILSKQKPSNIVAISLYDKKMNKPRPPWITCYLVGPDWPIKKNPKIQEFLINQMVEENIITKEFAGSLSSDPMPARGRSLGTNETM
jgi:hypothetical protein